MTLQVLKMVMPSILPDEKKVWQAFRECCSNTADDNDDDDDGDGDGRGHSAARARNAVGVKVASGVSAETFVGVMERMGLLGVQQVRAPTAPSHCIRYIRYTRYIRYIRYIRDRCAPRLRRAVR